MTENDFKCAIDRVRVCMTDKGAAVLIVGWRVPDNLPLSEVTLGNCSKPVISYSIPRPDVSEALGLESGNYGFTLKYCTDVGFNPTLTFYREDGSVAGTACFAEHAQSVASGESKNPRRIQQFISNIQALFRPKGFGINVIGYIRGEIGLGESTRLVAKALLNAKIPISVYNVEFPGAMRYRESVYDTYISDKLLYKVNLIHLNPPELLELDVSSDTELFAGKYNIGFWLWETDELPENWLDAFSIVNEIWCPSEFACNLFRKYTNKPVMKIVYPISPQINAQYDRSYFGLDDNLVWFLCMFDVQSTLERKNPVAAIHAYISAFDGDDSDTGIVIKVNNSNEAVTELLKYETQGLSNVKIIDEKYNKQQVNSLIKCCDVFVSLHRSEGFGLPIAEAMYLGKPVIATNYSANAEFMTNENSCPVGYTLVEIPGFVPRYGGCGYWAEPDLKHASEYMRNLAHNSVLREQIGSSAAKYMQENFSEQRAVESLKSRIEITMSDNKINRIG